MSERTNSSSIDNVQVSNRGLERTSQSGERATCTECDGLVVSGQARGELVCEDCGLVVEEDRIDHGPEWRDFDPEDHDGNSRVGPPITNRQHDRGLSTNIDWRDEDAYGRSLDPERRAEMRRLRTWDERFRTRDSKGRTLKLALGEVDRMSSALSLPTVVRETASVLFRRALDEELLPGRSIEAVSTACVYVAARQADIPRSLDELEAVSRTERQEIARAYRYLARELGLGLEPTRPREFLQRFTSALELTHDVESRAGELLATARDHGIDIGRNPTSMAAAAIYAAALFVDEETTQEAVAATANVSEATVRKRYRELLKADPDHPL